MTNNILLLGKNGQVGWELQRALQPLGEVLALDSHSGDVSDFVKITGIFDDFQPSIVVNAAAYTGVDTAETEREQADLINHHAVAHLAEQCNAHHALLVHYSTDYVFHGGGDKAWLETDPCKPINHYGQSKRNGEISLEKSNVGFINFRTSWVYATHGHNFIKTMLKLAKERQELSIINDQIGVPTSAALIADVTAHAIWQYIQSEDAARLHGHYHLAARGETSWYDYATFIFNTARDMGVDLALHTVHAIATSDYPTPAVRPLNSRLNTSKLEQTFCLQLPHWKQGVTHTLGEIFHD